MVVQPSGFRPAPVAPFGVIAFSSHPTKSCKNTSKDNSPHLVVRSDNKHVGFFLVLSVAR